jgi:hypothetical protein
MLGFLLASYITMVAITAAIMENNRFSLGPPNLRAGLSAVVRWNLMVARNIIQSTVQIVTRL